MHADFSNANLQSAKLVDGSFMSSKFCSANMSTCDITNSDMFNADFDNANMKQVVWNKDTKTFGTNIESAKNVPPELVQHHKDQHDVTSPIKLMFYSAWNKMLNFANINTDAIQSYVYTAVLSAIVALSLPVILATAVAAFVVPPIGVVFTVIGALAVTIASSQQIVYYSVVANPIRKLVNQITKIKNKILSSDSNSTKNSPDVSKGNDTLSNAIASKTINVTKTKTHSTATLQSNTEKTVKNRNTDIDEVKLKNKITRKDNNIAQHSSVANRSNSRTVKQNIIQSANNMPKVTTNNINGDHTKNQQQNSNEQFNQLLIDNPNVKKLQASVKLDGEKNKVRQSSTQISVKKDSNSRTP